MTTKNLTRRDLEQGNIDQSFGLDIEDTTGGAITMLLVVFALISVGLVVYTSVYPLGMGLTDPLIFGDISAIR